MKKPKFIPEFDDIPTPRVRMPELPLEKREGNFDEVELGLTQELARAEAARCLSCRRCIGCGLCLAECDPRAIVYDQTPEERRERFDGVLLAAGSSCFDATSKPALAYPTSPNVVTTVELSRMLSPTGPYGGLALRPGDGTPPKRVAFVQCVGSREEGIGANYCSTTCCNTALTLADRLLRSAGAASVTVFHRGMRPFGRRGESLYRTALDDGRVEFVLAEVSAVVAADCTEPVTVEYDRGRGEETAEFDLVVLSIGTRASSAARSIARRVRAPLNKFGFVATDLLRPVPVGVEDAPVAGSLAGPTDAAGAACAAQAAASGVAGALGVERAHAAAGPPAGERPGDGRAVVWVCAYGLGAGGPAAGGVASAARSVDGVAAAGWSDLACAPKEVAEIARAADDETVARVLVVGCHPGTHDRFWRDKAPRLSDRPVSVELIERSTDLAAVAENIRASLAEGPNATGSAESPRERRVLVVGGGPSALAAADEASRRGAPVTLVVEGSALGGRHAGRSSLTEGLSQGIEALAEGVRSDASIEVLLESTVEGVEDDPAGFVTRVAGPEGVVTVHHGAIVIATDDRDHEPSVGTKSGKGRVITQPQLAEALSGGTLDAKEIVVIQCVGSRSPEHPYCSRVCCAEAMTNVLRVREQTPDAAVTVLHRGIRVWGFDEERFADAVDLGVRFVEVESQPEVSTDGAVEVSAVETDGGGPVALTPDLVVLSAGVVPSAENARLAEALAIPVDGDGFLLPADEALRPVETCRPGVFVCGTASWPASVAEAATQGRAGAGKACLWVGGGGDDTR